MEIGEKIKMLRMQKLMTQSELAGSEITRNMISRIEKGVAQPSLDTLRYIAARLNVSPGFLLAESGDEQIYFKYNEMNGIKATYLSGNYRICRDICLNSASIDDDEVKLILAECTVKIAIEEFVTGNLHTACEYFDLALDACAGTIYDTGHIAAISAMYFRYMRRISATLSSNFIDETDSPIYEALDHDFCRYAAVFLDFNEGNCILRALLKLSSDSPYGIHIEAIEHMREGRYSSAYELLHRILVSDDVIPEPMMYFVFCDLEVCCKEINDFKGAYEYSLTKIELLQKLLS